MRLQEDPVARRRRLRQLLLDNPDVLLPLLEAMVNVIEVEGGARIPVEELAQAMADTKEEVDELDELGSSDSIRELLGALGHSPEEIDELEQIL